MYELNLNELKKIKGGYPCPPIKDEDKDGQPVTNGDGN